MAYVARCILILNLRSIILVYFGFYIAITNSAAHADLSYGDYHHIDLRHAAPEVRVRRQASNNTDNVNSNGSSTVLPPVGTTAGMLGTTAGMLGTTAGMLGTTAGMLGTTAGTRGTTKSRFDGKIVENHYRYYSAAVDSDKVHFNKMWLDLGKNKKATRHDTLSKSHRVAAMIALKFPFRFYGHALKNVTIATGGFLYMSPFLHKFLTATQYIAPLMANFHAGLSHTSHIYYLSTDQYLRVEWTNILLDDQEHLGAFTFQVILFHDNTISFLYKTIPVDLNRVSDLNHPVKVGLSDAYYINVDKKLDKLGTHRPTIFEYHQIKINISQLRSGIAVRIRPHATCNLDTTCSECIKARQNFDCRWCQETNKCSDGFDWNRHEWLLNRCHDKASNKVCPVTATKIYRTTKLYYTSRKSHWLNRVTILVRRSQMANQGLPIWAVVLIVLAMILILCLGVGGSVIYAYRHPTSRSGLWLIQHRPSQMKDKLAKMKFWKRGTSGEERYGVESTT